MNIGARTHPRFEGRRANRKPAPVTRLGETWAHSDVGRIRKFAGRAIGCSALQNDSSYDVELRKELAQSNSS